MHIKERISKIPVDLQHIIYSYNHQMLFSSTLKTIIQGGISNIEEMPDLLRDYPILYSFDYPKDDSRGWSARVSEFLHKVSF